LIEIYFVLVDILFSTVIVCLSEAYTNTAQRQTIYSDTCISKKPPYLGYH
jgi:hypothetical protein